MANLLQSSQTQATSAPGYYNDYLSSLATKGQNAVNQAQYVGAQPLQQAAFEGVQSAGTAYQPTLNAAEQTLNAATSATSPLAAASPYLSSALTNPAQEAAGYMSPYVQSVINNMSDIGQRNIMQNLAPAATAAAVGSGQYGSKRGAEVLGQTEANALRDLNANIANTLNTGYNTALQTAVQQNQVANQAGSTAANAAGTGQSNLTQAGAQQGNLAATNQQLGLADINALSTLGQQQQTIGQNAQLFPLNNLSTLSGILRGYNIPTTTTTQLTGSPLSALASLGAGTAGLFQGTGTSGTGPNLFSQITGKSTLQDFLNSLKPTVPVGSVNGNPDGLANVDTSKWTNNGDGTFTTSTGQIVDQNGNPVI
jgi:hypothetical protein